MLIADIWPVSGDMSCKRSSNSRELTRVESLDLKVCRSNKEILSGIISTCTDVPAVMTMCGVVRRSAVVGDTECVLFVTGNGKIWWPASCRATLVKVQRVLRLGRRASSQEGPFRVAVFWPALHVRGPFYQLKPSLITTNSDASGARQVHCRSSLTFQMLRKSSL